MARRRRYTPPFTVAIDSLAFGGVGRGEHEGRPVLVRGAPPGSVVEAAPFKRKDGTIHARRLATVSPPPQAMAPRCAVFGQCGGCMLQELSLEAQRAAKQAMVEQALAPLEGVEVHGIRGQPQAYGYRNKVELTFGCRRHLSSEELAAGGELYGRFLGFHAPASFERLVDVARCELVSEALNQVLTVVREHLAVSALAPWHAREHTGFWRHLLLRESQTGERLVAFYTAPPESPELARQELAALAARLPHVHSVVWFVNPRTADAAIGELEAVLSGEPWIDERLGELRFRLSPTAFFQTNTPGAECLYQVVAEAAGSGRRLLDLYSGTGSIALWLAPGFQEVWGVESNAAAVADARANAEVNGREVGFLVGEVEALLRGEGDLPRLLGQGDSAADDVVVVDPPRAGLHPKVAAALAQHPARRLVYVACHAPSLARDRLVLEAGGYRMTGLWTVDLFPQTGHVEAVARFDRQTAPRDTETEGVGL